MNQIRPHSFFSSDPIAEPQEMTAHFPIGHLASVLVMLDEASKAPTRVGMRVRLRNLPDVTGTDDGPARRPGERLVVWEDRDGAWTISATQIEAAP